MAKSKLIFISSISLENNCRRRAKAEIFLLKGNEKPERGNHLSRFFLDPVEINLDGELHPSLCRIDFNNLLVLNEGEKLFFKTSFKNKVVCTVKEGKGVK